MQESPIKPKYSHRKFSNTPILSALNSENPSEFLFPHIHKKPSTHHTDLPPTGLSSPASKLNRTQYKSISEYLPSALSPTSLKQDDFFPTEIMIKPKTSKTEEHRYAYYTSDRIPIEKTPYSRKVGPGYYSVTNSASTPSFSFPISSRFECDKLEKLNCKY